MTAVATHPKAAQGGLMLPSLLFSIPEELCFLFRSFFSAGLCSGSCRAPHWHRHRLTWANVSSRPGFWGLPPTHAEGTSPTEMSCCHHPLPLPRHRFAASHLVPHSVKYSCSPLFSILHRFTSSTDLEFVEEDDASNQSSKKTRTER